MMSRLWSWLRGHRQENDVEVILYTRPGCHLCDTAHEQLEQARRRWGFRLAEVEIDTDPELASRYGECVPVVTVNGKVRFRGRVNEVLLARLLDALRQGRPEPDAEG
jgi:glutaredoxin